VSPVELFDASIPRAGVSRTDSSTAAPFGVVGSPGTRLLAGPDLSSGRETLASHERRLGALQLDRVTREELRATVRQSGLLGRGGAGFPTATKFDVAATAPGTPIVVVNASEGEPASRKDRTLLEMRPHLILDGADVAAHATGADEIVVYLHRSDERASVSLERALSERRKSQRDVARVRVVDAPHRYVAGETSAVVSYLDGRGALPRRRAQPAARVGIANRPTVVNNAESLAHLALIARHGADWFKQVGSASAPGSTLITLAGSVAVPGLVVEILGPTTIGQVLERVGGLDVVPRAILLGGYEGTWISGEVAWHTPLERHALGELGMSLGCGLVAVLNEDACGLVETARLLHWLAGQSSGQCGSCVFGLPAMAQSVDQIVTGSSRGRDSRRLRELAGSIRGRGACGHPTGAVNLVESAMDTFADELKMHLRGAACEQRDSRDHFPLPFESGRV
jgi:NADH:ubiquinone oxidoreductase subunit F (NADH-binding)